MSRQPPCIALLAVLLLCGGPAAATAITYTGQAIVIASPGSYVLANDITNCPNPTCIEIRASDVVLDGNGHLVDGTRAGNSKGIAVFNPWGSRNVTVKNVRVRDWDYGVSVQGALDAGIESSVLENNLFCGAMLYLDAGRGTVRNCTVRGNVYGVVLSDGADNATVAGNRVESNECGLYLYASDGVTVTRNVVANNTESGLLLYLADAGTLYDNRFSNARNVEFAGTPGANAWSVAPGAGPNVAGGPSIGGNLWTRPGGGGFSDLAPDANRDGFADGVYAVAAANVDDHPLAASVGQVPTPEPTPTPELPTPTETSVPWVPTPVPLTTTPSATLPALATVPGGAGPPTDPDRDGVYDDVNGNGRKDFADVTLFFSQMAWLAGNEPVAAFDVNRNGRIDFADVVALFAGL